MPPRRKIAAASPPPGRPKSRPWRSHRGGALGELRDRFLEHVNAEPPALPGATKYDVSPRMEGREAEPQPRLLAG